MKIVFDTNVIVSALIVSHPLNSSTVDWFKKVVSGEVKGIISDHSLAELYSTLTSLPVYPQITSEIAYKLISHNVYKNFRIIEFTKQDYKKVLEIISSCSASFLILFFF